MQDRIVTILRRVLGTRRDWRLARPSTPSVPHFGVHTIGPVIAVSSLLVGWFAFTNTQSEEGGGFSLFIGSVSILMMAWSNFLSTRVSPLEKIFGGLDHMYRWHRWFGALSVGAMWLHMELVDDVKGIRGASKDIADAAEDLAETGSTLLYILIAASLLRVVPTRWWRISHKFLVLPYAFASWHFYTSTKPYANGSAWGWWFTTLMVLGVVAWAYRVVWRDMVRRGKTHRISGLHHVGDSLTLELEPLGAPMRYQTGQFAFVKVDKRGLSEPHPFTIASSPNENVLRFVIKDLGDWTRRVGEQLHIGDRVIVEGPYGKLPLYAKNDNRPTVWIAGGVGITPFLGAATTRSVTDGTPPHLFYCVRSRNEAPGLIELEQAHREGRIELHVHSSADGNRLRGEDISAIAGRGFSQTHVVMCGPSALVTTMRSVVRSLGVRHVHVEAFDIRTGVGPDLSRDIDTLTHSPRVQASIRNIAARIKR